MIFVRLCVNLIFEFLVLLELIKFHCDGIRLVECFRYRENLVLDLLPWVCDHWLTRTRHDILQLLLLFLAQFLISFSPAAPPLWREHNPFISCRVIEPRLEILFVILQRLVKFADRRKHLTLIHALVRGRSRKHLNLWFVLLVRSLLFFRR